VWLALLLVLAPIGVLLLYFLKLKRRPLQVPSTFLWKKSIEDLHVNALFQWLRQNVVLLLQLLVLLVLIYASLGLRFHGQTATGRHYIIMIDNSASMAAIDVKPSRLEWGKEEALKVIDAAEEGHQAWSSFSIRRPRLCRVTRPIKGNYVAPSTASSKRTGRRALRTP